VARLGTSLNIGKDLGKKEPDIKVEELDPKEVDKTTQKSLKEPQKVKIEKYGEHTIPNAILKLLDTYGLAILLLLSIIAGIWSLQAPLQLNHVGDTVEEIFWRDLSSQSALKMDVDFPLLGPEEKSRLFDMEFGKTKKDPQILGKLDKFVTDAKSLFIDNNGYVYLFNRDAYNYINAADKGEGSLGFLYTFIGPFTGQSIEHFAAVLAFILGIFSIILMFFIGNLFGKYGGFFAAFLMAFHPSFIKFMHLGKFTNALVVIPLTSFMEGFGV